MNRKNKLVACAPLTLFRSSVSSVVPASGAPATGLRSRAIVTALGSIVFVFVAGFTVVFLDFRIDHVAG
jgi:hypothetical protein